ncbi:MAG: hypothetical protein NWE89_06020 [Candidatus Bathyarchaeota archaeon]|nr:hypothetical protein [Candidatus Bathyarchaeota archaeon]
MSKPSRTRRFFRAIRRIPSGIKNAILEYEANYKRGVEKYGIWWKVFNWSIWAIILVLLFAAAAAFIFIIPRLQMLKYI